MKAKYAKIIRQGILSARQHSLLLHSLTFASMPREVIEAGMRTITDAVPKHPLAIRAYVHEVESQYGVIQKKMNDVQGRVAKSPFIGTPPPPKVKQPKSAPKIADGFHD